MWHYLWTIQLLEMHNNYINLWKCVKKWIFELWLISYFLLCKWGIDLLNEYMKSDSYVYILYDIYDTMNCYFNQTWHHYFLVSNVSCLTSSVKRLSRHSELIHTYFNFYLFLMCLLVFFLSHNFDLYFEQFCSVLFVFDYKMCIYLLNLECVLCLQYFCINQGLSATLV